MYLRFEIKIPTIIESIVVYFLLRYRKKRFGYSFRKIKLTRGLFAKVDPEDFDRLNKFSWYAMSGTHSFYAYRSVTILGRKKAIAMHNQIMQPPPGRVVDHDNHEGLDNRKANLHIATISQNNCNRRRMSNCRSKYRGVDYDKGLNKWRARIRFNNVRILLGYFDNEEDAARAYDEAAKEIHRDFAVLNFPLTESPQDELEGFGSLE